MAKEQPIDPLTGGRFCIRARVVTMDDRSRVLAKGAVYVDRGVIVRVGDAEEPPPAGFETAPRLMTLGTLFPGFIELHNHISYNALPLWEVPRRFSNRDQWAGIPDYRRLVSGPMTVIGRYTKRADESMATYVPPLTRYVECKALLGGVTTTQGVKLFSNAGVQRFYRGVVRNVEQTDEAALPEAAGRIPDVTARTFASFRKILSRETCCLLHLSEGLDETARKHFLALKPGSDEAALSPSLAGIHCAGLLDSDYGAMAAHGAAMIWSPLSNLLLYGGTARIAAARREGVRIGMGPDWSPSGSKNMLGELKAARVASEAAGGVFTDRDLVALATRDAARILGWEKELGSIEPGRKADFVVVAGTAGDPYERLLRANEPDIVLVVIGGVPRYGTPGLLKTAGVAGSERIRVGGRDRELFLDQATADPLVRPLTLARSRAMLREALAELPRLAEELETPRPKARRRVPAWGLALDEIEETGVSMRPRLALPGTRAATGPATRAPKASAPLSQILAPVRLDPLTVADDGEFLESIARQRNLTLEFKKRLAELY
jgi:cytosine/adenosine deaminase-related metal-dependent hydrolase